MNLKIFSLGVDFLTAKFFRNSAAAELAPQTLVLGARTASLSRDCPDISSGPRDTFVAESSSPKIDTRLINFQIQTNSFNFIPHPEDHTREGMDEWSSGGIPLHGIQRDSEREDTKIVRSWSFINRGFKNTLVLIPGWAADERIFAQLDWKYNYLIPGKVDPFGFSKKLLDYLDKNSISKVSLFGHSMGGFMAKEFALNYPERVDEVFLIGVRKKYPNPQLDQIKEQLKKNKRGFLYKFYLECFSENDKESKDWFKKNLLRDYVNNMSLEDLLRGLDYLDKAEIVAGELGGINNLKVFHGSEDRIAPIKEIKGLAGSNLIVMDGVGHIPFLYRDLFL